MSSAHESQPGTKPRKRFEPYIVDAPLRQQIKPLHQLNNWRGLVQVAEDWGWIATSIVISQVAWAYCPFWLAFSIYLSTIILIGARQRGLRVTNHQATHHALLKNRHLSYWVSALFCAWPTLESYSGYDDTHNSKAHGHHYNLGTDRDVDHQAVVAQGLYGEQRQGFQFKLYLLALPLKTPAYWLFLLKSRVFNPHEKPQERWMRFAFWLFVIVGCSFFRTWHILGLYWFVPLLSTANWVGAIIQLAEHYPLMEMGHTSELYVSRNRIMHPFWNIFLSTHQEGYHLVHHIFPGLPFWNLKAAHQILMQDPRYAELHQTEGIANLFNQLDSGRRTV
jgi:fatty acid desaturase